MYLKCTGSSFTFAPKQSCWKSKANFNFTARQPPDTEQMNAAANTSIKSYIKTAVLSLPVRRKDTDIAEERSEGRRSVEKVVESTQCTTHPPDSRKALGKEALWLHSNITLNSVWGQSNSLAHGSQTGHQFAWPYVPRDERLFSLPTGTLRALRGLDARARQMKVQFRAATCALTYRAVSVRFDASPKGIMWVEKNVNFMPYRLWLKSLMDTCRVHDRLICVFSWSFLSIAARVFLAFDWNGRRRNGKDMHKMRH